MAAHRGAAVFDGSPFGKIEVSGPDAEAFLQHVCANDMDRPPGSAVYTPVLNARGTYESDITVQRLAEERYRLFTGAAAIRKDMAWLRRHVADHDVALADVTERYAVLGLMGPDAARIAAELGADTLNALGYFRIGTAQIAGCPVRAARLSYVGETGWELTCRAEDAPAIYAALTGAGAVPAGLHAQTSMRIEKGFAALGHELDSDVTPVEAGMARFCSRTKAFIGAEVVSARRQSGRRTLATIVFDDPEAVPLGHEPVYAGGEIIGRTTSAAFGYRIGRPVALGHVEAQEIDGRRVEIDIAGPRHAARMQFAPTFDPAGHRMRLGSG